MDSSEHYKSPTSNDNVDVKFENSLGRYAVLVPLLVHIGLLAFGLLFVLLENKVFSAPQVADGLVYYGLALAVLGIFICPLITTASVCLAPVSRQTRLACILLAIVISVAQVCLFRFGLP